MRDRSKIHQKDLAGEFQENTNSDIKYYRKTIAKTLQVSKEDCDEETKKANTKTQVVNHVLENLADNEVFQEMCMYPPRSTCRKKLVDGYHSSRIHGSQGAAKALERISRTLYSRNMTKYIKGEMKPTEASHTTDNSHMKIQFLQRHPREHGI